MTTLAVPGWSGVRDVFSWVRGGLLRFAGCCIGVAVWRETVCFWKGKKACRFGGVCFDAFDDD